jgi:hypothetical protein
VTEQEWLACKNPQDMLMFLHRSKASDRKLRLWACACCRGVWERLSDKRLRVAVETCERVADGLEPLGALATAELLAFEALDEIQSAAGERRWYYVEQSAALLVGRSCGDELDAARLIDILAFATDCAVFADSGDKAAARRREDNTKASLVQEIFGNPFRPPRLDPAWPAWNSGTVPKLAQAIYEERAFDCLPVLADALEEAGCTEGAILGHCRGAGPHVRGCWVVDLVLGKQ